MSPKSSVRSLLAVTLFVVALAIAPVCAGAPSDQGLPAVLDLPAAALANTPPPSVELFYDDETCEGYHNLRAAAVRFSVSERRQVVRLRYFLKGEPKPVQLLVYDASWAALYSASVTPSPLSSDEYRWFDHHISGAVDVGPGDFYVAMAWPKAGAEPHLGEDTTPPHAGRSHGSWESPQPPFALLDDPPMDLMIRAVVQQVTPVATNTPRPWGGSLLLPSILRQLSSAPARTPTATPTPIGTACSELVVNGGAETGAGWYFPVTAYTADYSQAQKHSGERSIRTGIETGSPTYSYSEAEQSIYVPTDAGTLDLTFWYYAQSNSAFSDDDWSYVLLIDSQGAYHYLFRIQYPNTNSRTWSKAEFTEQALGPYRGQTVTLHFATFNTAGGGITALYVDDVSFLACR